MRYLVKNELTQDDKDDILDLFMVNITDKYKMKYTNSTRIPNPNKDNTGNIIIDNQISNYSYKCYENIFTIDIRLSIFINRREFISDMKILKNRLKKFGFEAEGHFKNFKNYATSDDPWYYIKVCKRMFEPVKRIKS